jgi:hypothetical protein
VDGHPATARNGPLAGDSELTVANEDDQGRWPSPVVWSTGQGLRHVYDLMALAYLDGAVSAPIYAFRRTLADDEQPPEIRWLTPPRYLL